MYVDVEGSPSRTGEDGLGSGGVCARARVCARVSARAQSRPVSAREE